MNGYKHKLNYHKGNIMEQILQNLGVEIANKAVENAQLRAQLTTLQSENEQLKSQIEELGKEANHDDAN